MKKAVFLDRDGTLNEDRHYLFRPEDFTFLPGVMEALRMLMTMDYRLIMITNQSGIARGYYTEAEFLELNKWMVQVLADRGIVLDGIYYCPHLPGGAVKAYDRSCVCRKPKTGLFYKAAEEHGISLDRSVAVGDRLRDCAICRETGCRGYLLGESEPAAVLERVRQGKAGRIRWKPDLLAAAWDISNEK